MGRIHIPLQPRVTAMGKVMTNSGEGGLPELQTIPDHKASNGAAPLEMKADTPAAPAPEEKADIPGEVKPDEGLEAGDKEFPERVQKRINAKHKAMKEAQEQAEEAERFAETQYNERKLAESRYADLEGQLKDLQAKANPPAPVIAENAPKIEDFKTADGQ